MSSIPLLRPWVVGSVILASLVAVVAWATDRRTKNAMLADPGLLAALLFAPVLMAPIGAIFAVLAWGLLWFVGVGPFAH
jgi:hypothetical protein